jgi:hypothetical protein
LGYPYVYSKQEIKSDNLDEDKNILKVITKEDYNKNKFAVDKLTSFLSSIKAKRVDSNIILCSLKKEYFKADLNID